MDARTHPEQGMSLIEILVAVFLMSIGLIAVLPMLTVSTQGDTLDRLRINAANAARLKLEELRTVPYNRIGVGSATTDPPFLGFYDSDPVNNPGYQSATDTYLTDVVELSNGLIAVRHVTVVGVDDPLDGLAGADSDARVIDYKQIEVRVEFDHQDEHRTERHRIVMSGPGENVPPAPK